MRKETLKQKWPYLLPFVGLALAVLLLILLFPRRAGGEDVRAALWHAGQPDAGSRMQENASR